METRSVNLNTADVRPQSTTGGAASSSRVSSDRVWQAVVKSSFAVLSYVNPDGEPRSSGVVYASVGRRLYVVVAPDSWKARQISEGGRVSVTVPVRRGGHAISPVPDPAGHGQFSRAGDRAQRRVAQAQRATAGAGAAPARRSKGLDVPHRAPPRGHLPDLRDRSLIDEDARSSDSSCPCSRHVRGLTGPSTNVPYVAGRPLTVQSRAHMWSGDGHPG